eukprot:TRINITY_DN6976_c0_g6_i1.p1 TRINITY_DN6976_c0_g6~~TRINITY_DN6976_c0_g6_i1.p1  ORF type:complete len:262 (-),score=34.20 TRINITY_DN6976_c0_g6_i1:818-1603(-)
MSGIVPYIVRFANPEFPREIRIEASFFVVQLFFSSKTAVRLFISAGGILSLAKFLDLDMKLNKDINFMAIDCLNLLIQCKLIFHADLLSTLMKLGIPERIVVVVDSLVHEREESVDYVFLLKAMDIMIALAFGPPDIQEKMCESEILPLLFDASKYFNMQCLFGLCTFLRGIARNPSLLNHLENVGIVPLCSMLIKIGLSYKNDSSKVLPLFIVGIPIRSPSAATYLLHSLSLPLCASRPMSSSSVVAECFADLQQLPKGK